MDSKSQTISLLLNIPDALEYTVRDKKKRIHAVYPQVLPELRDSEFSDLLQKYSGCIYGGSAGAIIFGEDITTSHDENKSDLTDLTGLKFIRNFCIIPHFEDHETEKMKKFVSEKKFNVIAIPEKAGIHINDDVAKVYGRAPVKVFYADDIKTYVAGDEFNV